MEVDESGSSSTSTKKRFEVGMDIAGRVLIEFLGQKMECCCIMGLGYCCRYLRHLPKPYYGFMH